jgi:hypothetical protein
MEIKPMQSLGEKMMPEPKTMTAPQQQLAITPMQMLQMAVEQNADLDKMQQLIALQERWEANEARKAYMRSMTAFKVNPPEILKSKHVKFKTTKGVTEYDHAELDQISRTIGGALSEHKLSHAWKIHQPDGGAIRVTCVITHESGHSESVSLQAGADQSGGKNNIQAAGSTVTYLERYTLLAATGLAAKGQDNDAQDITAIEWITPEQAADLESLIEEVGANRHRFLKFLQAETVDKIRASEFPRAVAALEHKRGAA